MRTRLASVDLPVAARHAIAVAYTQIEPARRRLGAHRVRLAPERVLDLGDLRAARGMEMHVILWVSVMQHRGDPIFNITVAGR